ncbi:MAG: type II toxin-antitoxin system RelE/ParE family toxin [Rhodospirillales bacterium]|jgi:toxin ParE1/3/4|nr:type II toxin-antitoxin system RelE/ParE family toxin [Rhodospirillales bacterium]
MAVWRLRSRAEQDIRDIAAYTEREWGVVLRRAYLKEIETRFDDLAANPYLGVARDDVRIGYRSSHIGRHVVFYRQQGDGIDIVRVLHDRMDALRQFPSG